MRDDDDGEIRYFMPVVRRLVILAAVITAVPVVMWTITGFVRAYFGPVRAPTILAMSAAPVAPAPDQTASIPADNPPAPVDSKTAQVLPAPAMNAAADVPSGSQNGAGPGTTMTSGAPSAPQPTPAPPASAAATTGKMTMSGPAAAAPPAASAANSVWPAPPPMPATAPMAPFAPTASASPMAPVADALPASEPLAGPVPLPRKRPHSFVVAQASIPTPRARPAPAAATPAQATAYAVTPAAAEAPASSPFDWLVKLFQPSSSAAASASQEDLSGPH
jgi:hypothetical protein